MLGNAFIERNNSLVVMINKKDKKRYREGTKDGFNSIWAPD